MSVEIKEKPVTSEEIQAGEQANLNKEEQVPEDAPLIGTSAKIFPDLLEDETPVESLPEEKEVELEKKADEPKKEPKKEPKDKVEYLSLDDLGDKKVKITVDGVEKEVPFSELHKNYQTWEHLSRKGQKIAEQEKKFKDSLEPKEKPAVPAKQELPEEDEWLRPYIEPLYQKINAVVNQNTALSERIEFLQEVTRPAYYQSNLTDIDKGMKSKGFDDFLEFVPEIESSIKELEIANAEEFKRLNTKDGYVEIYKDLKLKKLSTPKDIPAEIPKKVDERPVPKVTSVESGSGPPAGIENVDASYQEAFKKAQDTGDWSEVLKLKGVI